VQVGQRTCCALMMTYYNFVRIHQTLRVTPAMAAAGVTDRLWQIGDIVALLDAAAPTPAKRGPYKKSAAEISNRHTTANNHDFHPLGP
jgi:hypothetical protein